MTVAKSSNTMGKATIVQLITSYLYKHLSFILASYFISSYFFNKVLMIVYFDKKIWLKHLSKTTRHFSSQATYQK